MKVVTVRDGEDTFAFRCGRVTLRLLQSMHNDATGPEVADAIRHFVHGYTCNGVEGDMLDFPVDLLGHIMKSLGAKVPLAPNGDDTAGP